MLGLKCHKIQQQDANQLHFFFKIILMMTDKNYFRANCVFAMTDMV